MIEKINYENIHFDKNKKLEQFNNLDFFYQFKVVNLENFKISNIKIILNF